MSSSCSIWPIEALVVKLKEMIFSLLLTKHTLPKGKRPVYQKKPTVKAHWISKDGNAQEQEVGKDEVGFPALLPVKNQLS